MKAEGILMHRSKNIIALRATQGTKTVVQVSIFNIFYHVRFSISTPRPRLSSVRFQKPLDSGDGLVKIHSVSSESLMSTTQTSTTRMPQREYSSKRPNLQIAKL